MVRHVRPRTFTQQLEKALWQYGTWAVGLWAAFGVYQAWVTVTHGMAKAGWIKVLGTDDPIGMIATCLMNQPCPKNFEQVLPLYNETLYLGPMVVFFVLGVFLEVFKKYPQYKAAAAGRLATRAELRKYLEPKAQALVGTLGLIRKFEWMPKWITGAWNYLELGIPEDEFNEHTFVYGPPGSGKTAGLYWVMLFKALVMKRSVVMFDVKAAGDRQGLFGVTRLFRVLGRPVDQFTPFSEHSKSLDLFHGCESFDKALEAASIFLPFKEGDDKFYRDQERRLLAGLIMDGKLQGGVRLDHILSRLNGGVGALAKYISRKPYLMDKLRTFLDAHPDKIAGAMMGLAGALEPLCKDKVALRLGGFGDCIDLERLFHEPRLFYVGVPQSQVLSGPTGPGALMMQLVKRVMDDITLKVVEGSPTGKSPVAVQVLLDELLNLGRMDNLRRMLSTVRSRNIGYVLGVQSHDDGREIYGENAWDAIVRLCRHRVIFCGALDPEEAQDVARVIGEIMVLEETISHSDGENGTRQGSTTKEATRPLVAMEEMMRWPRFRAIVFSRYMPPFITDCLPLFNPLHPNHAFFSSLMVKAETLPEPDWTPEITPAALVLNLESQTADLEDSPEVRYALGSLVVEAVRGLWSCELYRERGELVTARVQPTGDVQVPSISGVTWDGRQFEINGLSRLGEEFTNALVWLKRRAELKVWLEAFKTRIVGLPEYVGDPIGERVGDTLWMQSGEAARVFGPGHMAKKTIAFRAVDGVSLEVIAVGLTHKGLDKLVARLEGMRPKLVLEAAD
jgi:type IV secretory pathway TraG/TraD family ATPase VirD4